MLPTYLVPKWQFYSETPKKLWKIGLGLPENCLELNIDITKYIQTAPPPLPFKENPSIYLLSPIKFTILKKQY